jgi:folate-binding protein YgfZ
VEAITAGHSSMGAHCNREGRVLSLFYIFLFQDAYYLLMQREMVADTISFLKKYAVFFKVEITDVSDEWHAIGVQHINIDTPNVVHISIANDRYIVAGEVNTIKNISWPVTENITIDDWRNLNIEAGIPTLYAVTSSKFLPHEINLPLLNAVSFAKGCYTGQEIIARMHYKGKLKNRMVKAQVSDEFPLEPGMDIYDSQQVPVGKIVDIAHQAHNNAYSLLIITNDSLQDLYTRDLKSVLTVKVK